MGEIRFLLMTLTISNLANLVLLYSIYELWCGEIAGKINVFPVNESGVSGHQALCHSDEPNLIEDVKVARLCSNDSYVFSCLYPGCMVYQWGASSKCIENKLDCSKLLPCSESLQSIAIDERVNLIKCQISALATHNTELYIGTTWGCLIVAELQTLRPISVFRPYENEVRNDLYTVRYVDSFVLYSIADQSYHYYAQQWCTAYCYAWTSLSLAHLTLCGHSGVHSAFFSLRGKHTHTWRGWQILATR